jgi:hypothetical protein
LPLPKNEKKKNRKLRCQKTLTPQKWLIRLLGGESDSSKHCWNYHQGKPQFCQLKEGDTVWKGVSWFERKSLYYLQGTNGLGNHVRAGWLPNMTISHENQNTFFLFIHAKSNYEIFIQTVHSLFGWSWG